jgi:t-SNARE complex subunit (syntaxin)
MQVKNVKKKFLDQENHHSYLIKKSSYKESDSQSIQEQLDKEFQLYENKI